MSVLRAPAEQAVEAEASELAQVRIAQVGRDLTMGVTVNQPFTSVAVNHLDGVVTAAESSVDADVGTTAFEVAGTPVRVVTGQVPFWRDLEPGVSGVDVEQLQQALVDLDHLDAAVDGEFDAATEGAVRQWQEDEGRPVTGAIQLGELIAVAELPQTLRVDEALQTGALVGSGETALSARTGEIVFEMVLNSDQVALVPAEAQMHVAFDDMEWPAVIAEQGVNEGNQHVLTLTAPDGGMVCDQDCDELPAQEQLNLLATVQITPEVEGPAVPVTSVRTSTDGSTYVVLDSGEETAVEVLSSSGGIAVVDGLSEGQQVRLGDQDAGEVANGDEPATPEEPAGPTEPGEPVDPEEPTDPADPGEDGAGDE